MSELERIQIQVIEELKQELRESRLANAQYEVDLDEARNLAEIYKKERDDLFREAQVRVRNLVSPEEDHAHTDWKKTQSGTTLTSGQEIVITIKVK